MCDGVFGLALGRHSDAKGFVRPTAGEAGFHAAPPGRAPLTGLTVEHGVGVRTSRPVILNGSMRTFFGGVIGAAVHTTGSLSKYGLWASEMRTTANVDRAATGHLPRFLRSVLNRPSHQVRREMASGERFSELSTTGQSTGLPQKPQETCHSARRSIGRRARLVWELAEEVRPDTIGLCAP